MARSVSTPRGASDVAYASFSCEDEFDASYEFKSCIEYLQEVAMKKYPSLKPSTRWVGREDQAVLENRFCCITVSEYCGLVAIAIVPDEDSNLAANWCDKVDLSPLADCFGERLISRGRFSNGEQIFAAVSGKTGDCGIGFTSKEGWL